MIYIFVNIEEIKNILREFQAENSWKIKNTQADFKKVVSYKKKSVLFWIRNASRMLKAFWPWKWKNETFKTRPSRPIRCDVWIIQRLRYQPTNQPTDRATDTAS